MITDAALKSSYSALDHMVTKQAAVLSYMDVFFYLGILFLICVPFVLMVRGNKLKGRFIRGDALKPSFSQNANL
jgi:DHA2 family multidrug resistance protein